MTCILPGGLGQLRAQSISPVKVDSFAQGRWASSGADPGTPVTVNAAIDTAVLFAIAALSYGTADQAGTLTATFGAQSMTKLGSYVDSQASMNCVFFGLINPSTTGTIYAQSNSTGSTFAAGEYVSGYVATFSGTNKTALTSAFKNWTTSSYNSANSGLITVPSASINLIFAISSSSSGGGPQAPNARSFSQILGYSNTMTYQSLGTQQGASSAVTTGFPTTVSGFLCGLALSP